MLRPRLKTRTGCVRCRNRRKKCDETLPQCGFCRRWGFECVRLVVNHQFSQVEPNPIEKRLVLLRKPSRRAQGLDDFHNLPVGNTVSGTMVDGLYYFFVTMVSNALPFNGKAIKQTFAANWMEMIYADEVVCWAFAAYATDLRARRAIQPTVDQTSIHLGEGASRLLRKRVADESSVTEGTLLASVVHFVWAALDVRNAAALPMLYRGIEELIEAYGGFRSIERKAKPGTVLSIIISDTLSSCIMATPPRYQKSCLSPMCPPSSLSRIVHTSIETPRIKTAVDPRVTTLLHAMRVALFLRTPSRWTTSLASAEAHYVASLLQFIDHELVTLQARFLASKTISEIIILGLMLTKQEIISERAQHRVLIELLLARLRTAISTCRSTHTEAYSLTAIWSSIIAWASCEDDLDRVWFLDFVASRLSTCYPGEAWNSWSLERLRGELSEILWHEKVEKVYRSFCCKLVSYSCLHTPSLGHT